MGDRWARQLARIVGYGVAVVAVGALASAGVLVGQARQARRNIPRAEAPPPRGDGRYGGRSTRPPLTLVMLGDSVAAGYGVAKPRETPGALLAAGISRRLHRPVRLHRLAVVGSESRHLAPQVEAALELAPDLAVILVGGNDVTHQTNQAEAVRYLVTAVRTLRAAGAEVVVGTCPDLGTIRPIQPPLRWLARRWSRQLAAAQTVAVVEAGGWTVSLGDLLGPRFAAEPSRMFGTDRFHPSADGYAAAAAALLPTALAALGAGHPPSSTGIHALPRAAVAATRRAGTEVSGASVGGRERGPAGRWAALRIRLPRSIGPAIPISPSSPASSSSSGSPASRSSAGTAARKAGDPPPPDAEDDHDPYEVHNVSDRDGPAADPRASDQPPPSVHKTQPMELK